MILPHNRYTDLAGDIRLIIRSTFDKPASNLYMFKL